MNTWLISAALLSTLTAIVHSLLGEMLIFRHLRSGSALVPTRPAPPLRERNVRILWASWHLISVMGIALAWVIYELANMNALSAHTQPLLRIISGAYFVCGALVLIGTRGRHPGWIALMLVGGLIARALFG